MNGIWMVVCPKTSFTTTALPKDNPFVTQDQWNAWSTMDERYQKQYIEGDWTNFDDKDNRFAYCYDKSKHVGKTVLDRRYEVYLSFDFNHEPITCGVFQHYNNWIYGIEQIKLSNSNIYDICDHVLSKYGNCLLVVTGDATGRATSALVKDNINYYTVIKSKLNLGQGQIRVPSINPPVEENRVLVNYVLNNSNFVMDADKCKGLAYDLQYARVLPDGSLDKSNRNDPTKQFDCGDCFRYYLNTFHKHVLKQ